MKATAAFVALLVLLVTGCGPSAQQIADDERRLNDTIKQQSDGLDWKINVAVAQGLWDINTRSGFDRYETFLKCHSYPPTQDANRKVCADLQKRVAEARKKSDAQQAKEKAAW